MNLGQRSLEKGEGDAWPHFWADDIKRIEMKLSMMGRSLNKLCCGFGIFFYSFNDSERTGGGSGSDLSCSVTTGGQCTTRKYPLQS